jgi:hypothetical protein
MITVTFQFGLSRTYTGTFPNGTTVGQALADETLRNTLRFGSNVRALRGGGEVSDGTPLSAGATYTLETRQHDKAGR